MTVERKLDFDLGAFLIQERGSIEAALERSLEALLPLFRSEFAAPARHGVLTGGKRLRPILCATAFAAVDTGRRRGPPVYDLAVSLELIHAYSLMHDDLPCLDDAALRRGKPTPHTLFGERATTVAGVALIPAASIQAVRAAQALGCDDATVREIVSELNAAAGAGGMVGGQVLDVLGEDRVLTAEELDRLHRRKTGALLTASLTIGARAAGASGDQLGAFSTYGRSIGLAFQVADDILDATSSAEDLGKNPSDVGLGKSTYVALYGLEEAERRAVALSEEAREALKGASIHSPALDALAGYVVERKK
jgi:geranylgeranyl diphosphate synthase, type II